MYNLAKNDAFAEKAGLLPAGLQCSQSTLYITTFFRPRAPRHAILKNKPPSSKKLSVRYSLPADSVPLRRVSRDNVIDLDHMLMRDHLALF